VGPQGPPGGGFCASWAPATKTIIYACNPSHETAHNRGLFLCHQISEKIKLGADQRMEYVELAVHSFYPTKIRSVGQDYFNLSRDGSR
jgi:hypothetical protein